MSRSALIIGATGQAGRHLLRALLASPSFSQVTEYGRRVTPADQLPADSISKLVQKTVDFEHIDEAAWKEGRFDTIFITLGTTRAQAGSAAAFEKIDREYVVNSAKAARVNGLSQRLVYLSSGGANPSSLFPYTKSKGITEIALAALGYETIIFRPGVLVETQRKDFRPAEKLAILVTSVIQRFTQSLQMPVPILAKSMLKAGELGCTGLPANLMELSGTPDAPFTLIDQSRALALASP